MKVAIYARVSTEEQNVENQIQILEKYAKQRGWEYETHTEQESSRKTRPIKNKLYHQLLRREFDGLLIYKFDRWARSTSELVGEVRTLVERGVEVHSFNDGIDLNSSMGKAMLTIISAFAELERDIIRERTLAGLARAKAEGKTLGRPKGAKDKGYRKRRRIRE